MNISIISNFSKTYLHTAISHELKKYSIDVYWIACNRKLANYLSDEFGAGKVLLINRENVESPSAAIGEFKINELVYGDRVWRHEPANGLEFLTNIQRPVYQFLKNNKIRKVFGEVTWAHELLIHRICEGRKELNCQFLNPHVIRIPNQRFAFFTDERQSELLQIEKDNDFDWEPIIPKAPNYLAVNKKIWKKSVSLSGRLERVKRFITNENIDNDDPTLLVNNKIRVRKATKEEANKLQYKTIKKSVFNPKSKRPFVFVGLHKQPEASVDVLGRYYEDQLQNIKNLWRALPGGWDMIVKEHTVAIGDRSIDFYKDIQALPNVYLVDEETPSYDIIRNASLVVTISGTIAYEAALMGIPSATFAPCFFNGLNGCVQIKLEHLAKFDLSEISEILKQRPSNLDEFSQHLFKNSFEGNVLDPVTDPTVLEKENIKILLAAFLETILSIKLTNPLTVSC